MTDVEVERPSAREQRAKRRLQRPAGRAFWVRSIALAVFDALAIWVIAQLFTDESYAVGSLFVFAFALVNWAYLNPRAQASRWLTPGLVLMALFVVYPVLYTAYISFTNYQTGNLLSKSQAIERLEEVTIRTGASGEVLEMLVYRDGDDELALLVGSDDTAPYAGRLRPDDADPETAEARPVGDPDDIATVDLAEPPDAIDGFELLPRLAVTGESSRLEGAVIDLPDGRAAEVETLSAVRVVTGGPRFEYDSATDTLTDLENGWICPSGEGTFYCDRVPFEEVQRVALIARDSPIKCESEEVGALCDDVPLFAFDQSLAGWQEVIGFDNYEEVLTNERIREPFVRVLIWNVVFAFGSVLLNFALGLGLALALKREEMRGRSIYRAIYIVPYAIPAFLSILVWRGLLNAEFGKVNGVLNTFGIDNIDWLGGSGLNAQVSVFLVNLWLGFPYMFLICSGALTSIPDGARRT